MINLKRNPSILGLSGLLNSLVLITPASAINFQTPLPDNTSIFVPAIVNNETVGEIGATVFPFVEDLRRKGIEASFTATNGQPYNTFLADTLGGAVGINWLQFLRIEPSSSKPPGIISNLFVDPIAGGLGSSWADNQPWYWNLNLPNNLSEGVPHPEYQDVTILPGGKQFDRNTMINSPVQFFPGSNGFVLNFSDYPGRFPIGTNLHFSTFLVAEFPGKTYDTFGGFSWTANIDETGKTKIVSLKEGATFNSTYANLVSAFGDGGYTKVLRLPTYQYSRNLSTGAVHNFDITGLPTNPANFLAWTNNQLAANPTGQPDTILGVENSGRLPFFYRYFYPRQNDDGGPYENNQGSGLRGRVNFDRTIHLKVSGSEDSDFDGKVYTNSVCVKRSGGSGGGGCVKWRNIYQPHSEVGKYELLVKLYETNFPNSYPYGFNLFSSASLLSNLSAGDEVQAEDSQNVARAQEKVPEPTAILGLLALGAGGILVQLTHPKDK